MSRFSAKVGLVDWDSITLEGLKLYKMKIGMQKHGDPEELDTPVVAADLLRKFAEYILSCGSGDYRDIMEILSDISNMCDMLFPKIQRAYVEELKGQPPDCFATEQFNSLQCRSEPCAWRMDCKQILGAELGRFLREMDMRDLDRFSTRME